MPTDTSSSSSSSSGANAPASSPDATGWSTLTPTVSQVEALREQVGPGPVVMLNLLKFRQPGGREAMARYGAVSGPLVMRSRGEVVYAGEGGPLVAGRAGEDWDTVILVRFPDIDAFIALVADPVYQAEAAPLREEALERTLWMVSRPAGSA
jgi:uncharacterized protein (DUF1330 family)